MKTLQTNSLGVSALNYLIARNEDIAVVWNAGVFVRTDNEMDKELILYSPATDPGQAGPLNHVNGISLVCVPRAVNGHDWKAFSKDSGIEFFSPDPLLASMRSYVHLYYGHEVKVPAWLV